VLSVTGCLHYTARITVKDDGSVVVTERLVPDPEWRAEAADSLGATQNLLEEYAEEVGERGGEAQVHGLDSVTAIFRYPSLAAFAHGWPDTLDNRSFWDRSLHRRSVVHSKPCEELVLFRMSPPDREAQLPNQRYPVLDFVIELPVPAETTNAHASAGRRYAWRFTEQMPAADSVWVAWPMPNGK
jgi:hypothetical protein